MCPSCYYANICYIFVVWLLIASVFISLSVLYLWFMIGNNLSRSNTYTHLKYWQHGSLLLKYSLPMASISNPGTPKYFAKYIGLGAGAHWILMWHLAIMCFSLYDSALWLLMANKHPDNGANQYLANLYFIYR